MNTLENIKNINDLLLLKEKINESIDKQISKIQNLEKILTLENASFRVLKNIFENMSENLFKTKEGRKLISSYINTINESKNLKNLFFVNEILKKENCKGNFSNVEKLLFEESGINKNIKEDVSKISQIVIKSCLLLNETKYIDDVIYDDEFDNSVNYIMENKYSLKNATDFQKHINIIKERIESDTVFHENKNISEKISNFNLKFEKELTESEKERFKNIINEEKQESIFEDSKKNCIETLNNVMLSTNDKEEKNILKETIEKLHKKKFNPSTISTDIVNFEELSSAFLKS